MSGSMQSEGDDTTCEIQIAPMVDCVFLLLLYYIAVSSLEATIKSDKVALPEAHQGLTEENQYGRFLVDVEWDESLHEATYRAGPKVISDPRDLVPLIQKNAQMVNSKIFRVVIRADYQTPYKYTQQVMAAIAEANVPNIIFSTVEKRQK